MDEIVSRIAEFVKTNPNLKSGIGDFEIIGPLGQGGTSIVYEASINGISKHYAIKIFCENIALAESTAYKRFKQAYVNIGSIQHLGFVVPQIHWDYLKIGNSEIYPFSIMLKAENTLDKKYKNSLVDKDEMVKMIIDLGNKIEKMHMNGIIHRDLKPQNIFFINEHLLIGDCDIAMYDESIYLKLVKTNKNERLGNYQFSSPEQQDTKLGLISESSDWYAFGQIIYWLSEKTTYKGIGNLNLKCLEGMTEKAIIEKIVKKLLQAKPEDRFQSFHEIEKYWKDERTSRNGQNEDAKINRSLYLFDEIIYKYTSEYGMSTLCINEVAKDEEIMDIVEYLKDNIEELQLWMIQGYADWEVTHIEDLGNCIYQFEDHIVKIEKISAFRLRYDFGGSLFIIHTDEMKALGKSIDARNEEICYFENRIISRQEYDTGWAIIDGKRVRTSGKTSIATRTLKKSILFLCPQFGPKQDNFDILEKVYEMSQKKYLASADYLDLLKSMKRSWKAKMND